MDSYQFYPTPLNLAAKAWSLFKNKNIHYLLEPSAGNGDLLSCMPNRPRREHIHLCELDVQRHPTLREKGEVVGIDFLDMHGLEIYSHIIMNPPFRHGAQHLLHAWKGMYSGEIVAILNAESIKNPYTEDRQRLVSLIREHGSVTFLQEAFQDPDTLRKTSVEIALVWLEKKSGASAFRSEFLDALHRDSAPEELPDIHFGDLALPGKVLENLVTSFHLAWEAEKQAYFAEIRADHYRSAMGEQFESLFQDQESKQKHQYQWLSGPQKAPSLSDRWDSLKNRAWTSILTMADTEKYLTSKAVQRIRSEFQNISKLEFSVANIYGFLQGLAENQGNLQIEILTDLFDRITRSSENAFWYKPWKSNDKHRIGMKIRNTRFILGGFSLDGWRKNLSWDQFLVIKDLDRAFAILDGKAQAESPLADLFNESNPSWDLLCRGKRLSSTYFDVRYYKGVGSIHFYPKNPAIIDRLNLLVGRHRQWIPEQPDDGFQRQYDAAEKVTKTLLLSSSREIQAAIQAVQYHGNDKELRSALEQVLNGMGLNFSNSLSDQGRLLPAPDLDMAPQDPALQDALRTALRRIA